MKAVGSNITRGIGHGAKLECADNTGAKMLKVTSIINYKGTRARQPRAGVGNIVRCSVIKGSPEMKEETPLAVIIRQRKEWRRPDGRRIKFNDNAAVLINERNEPRGNEIKGAVAKEVVERFPEIGKVARTVV
ncbi:MAG: 50S ribosomal protein L14 [Candidatus Aenigmatarchaeota archaeon]